MEAKFIKKKDIVITIPKTIKWEDYEKELEKVKDWSNVMNYKVTNFPSNTEIGKKCYICYNNHIIGWMQIVGFDETNFDCTTTGNEWSGKFIQRSGPFHKISPLIPMEGFRGFRYI